MGTTLQVAFTEKLAESDLTKDDARKLGFALKPGATISRLDKAFTKRGGFIIPYYHPNGKRTDFYRVRYLENPEGFAGKAKKVQRYAQPTKTAPQVYFPPLLDTSWAKYLEEKGEDDHYLPIIITEGELKAACACKHRWPTIGLGGVYAWRSARHQLPFLLDLERIEWKERRVYLVFDSDIIWKPDVRRALNHLASELTKRGAVCREVDLSSGQPDEKLGLDDFIVKYGEKAFTRKLNEAEPLMSAEQLWDYHTRFFVDNTTTSVYDMENQRHLSFNGFREVFANEMLTYSEVDGRSGKPRMVQKPLPEVYLKWPKRLTVNSLVYKPGAPRFISGDDQRFPDYNTWPGWGCEPKPYTKRTIKPWKDLVGFLFSENADDIVWFERWLAMQVQHPGVKLTSAVILHGATHGTGKTLLGEIVGRIFGTNYTMIEHKDLASSFNSWAVGKQFVMGDEVAGDDRRAGSELMKQMITRTRLRIEEKYQKPYEVDDCVNYLFTSNHPDPVHIETTDRRYFVVECPSMKQEPKFYERINDWMEGDGPSYLFQYLLDVDTSGFNPKTTTPPLTNAKKQMMRTSASDLEEWLQDLHEAPQSFFTTRGVGKPSELWAVEQLLELYRAERGGARLTFQGFSRALSRVGFRRFNEGRQTVTNHGRRILIVIDNTKHWCSPKRKPNEGAKHFNEHFPKEGGKGGGRF